MDFAWDGVKWWSLVILEGYSRTILAGAVAPTEATWVALMVRYTACLRYGVPHTLISDSGGASISNDFEAVCARLQIHHDTIESTQGASDQNLVETHVNIPRRLDDYQVSLARTPVEFEQRHQTVIHTDNTTAHQGLLHAPRLPPIPIEVLGEAKGRVYAPDELARSFSHALFARTTNRHGCVTLHSYHFDVEEGLPQTQVLLWVSGEPLRAVFENAVLAEYRCQDDGRDRKITDIREGIFSPTRFASPQGKLLPLTPQDSAVVHRARSRRRQAPRVSPAPQLRRFEVVPTGGASFTPHWCQGCPDALCEGDDTGEKRLAVAQQLQVGRFLLKIDGDGAVFPWWFGGVSHGSPPGQMVGTAHDHTMGVVIRKNRISTFFSMRSGPGRRRSLSMSASQIALDIGVLSHDNRRR
jgi:hypothetical protein